MNKKIRCGLLIETKDGMPKKIKTEDGGGTRFCIWDKKDLRFNEIHRRFRRIFELGRHHRTSICDFQHRPINFKQFATFEDYIDKFALSGRHTAIYLYIHNSDVYANDKSRMTMMKKKKTLAIKTPASSASKEKSSSSSIMYSSMISVQSSDHQQSPQSSSGNQSIIIDWYLQLSYLEYSFKIGSNELLNNVRDFIGQNRFDDIMIQLFQYICEIRSYTFSTIAPLKQQLEQSDDEYFQINNQSEIKLHSSNLENVYDICRSTKILLDLNKNKFGHSQIFSTITKPFLQFYHHFKILRNQWLESVVNNNNNTGPTASSSTGSRFLSTSNPHTPSSSQDHAHQTVPSSNLFKSISPFQTSNNNETNEKLSLFQPILNYFNNLLNLLHPERLSLPHTLVKSKIDEIEGLQININLFDKQSLCDAERVILSIKDHVNKKFYTQYFNRSNGELNRQLDQSHDKILKAIQFLLTSLHRYQLLTDQNNRQEGSNWSSPSPPFINQQQSNKRKSQNLHDDDQSSVTTSSSMADEILFIGARNAFGYKSRRFH